ncbi:hypothetical protein [Roseateles sp. LKC17W]|uniref:Uncharacterized protein n=1 Tax=Pelomonas margarita TaxID=3299031 RepID=A0ABW7FHQ5_9BURK
MTTTYVPPYTVTVTSTQGGLAACTYIDGQGQVVPDGQPLQTTTPPNEPGSLEFRFTETVVDGRALRLVGATAKTIGNAPTLQPYNNLYATRSPDDGFVDTLTVPWVPNAFTSRGVVLLFAQLDDKGEMLNFVPSTDPEVQNGPDE